MKPALSAQELKIVRHATLGHTDKEIARDLNISTRTVGTYWERIRTKRGSGASRTQLVTDLLWEAAQDAQLETFLGQPFTELEVTERVAKYIDRLELDQQKQVMAMLTERYSFHV